MTATDPIYVFDNAAPQAPARLDALANVFDPGTIRQLEARGTAEGSRCLEIGGGLGTITRWLASRVGLRGSVVTTDIDTRHLDRLQLPNVTIRRHDVVLDDLPGDTFDLAYMRLVLLHVTDAHRALANVVRAVRPGGWIVIEDFEAVPEPGDPALIMRAAMQQVMSAAGVDMKLGRSLSRRFRAAGLEQVGAEGRVYLWRGGSPGAALMRLNFEQLRDRMVATGLLTIEEYQNDLARLDDPEFEVRSPILWTAWGRRPTP